MDNWKKLGDLNLKDVQRRTQIEIECLEFILKKDFKSLSRFNVYGFTKILAREYELDFADFLEEYQVYLSENEGDQRTHVHISPRMNSYTKENSNLWYIILIILIIVGVLTFFGITRFFQSSDENLTDFLSLQSQSITKDKNEEETEALIYEQNLSILDDNLSVLDGNISDMNLSSEKTLDENLSLEDNETIAGSENFYSNQSNELAKELLQESIIYPKAELWLGMVDLKTFRKKSLTIKNEYKLSLKEDMLITTGHASFKLNDENNNTLEFKNGTSKFLKIKDGKIKEITRAEFIKENKGKLW